MATKITTRVLADDAVTDAKIADVTLTTATQSASDNTTKIATTAYVTTAIANLADSAPSTLNTLNELAAALGDDANYATTTTNAIAAKLPLAGGTLTGNVATSGSIIFDNNVQAIKIKDAAGTAGYVFYQDNGDTLVVGNGTTVEKIRLDTSGNEGAITIDTNGKVGIGLTNQDNKLQVDGDICIGKATTSGDLKSTLKMRGANGSNELQVFDLVNDGENGRVDFKYNRAGNAAQTIMSFGATVGNVGVGTSSPLSRMTIAQTSGNTALTFQQTNNGTTNFLIGCQYNVGNTFEITPSTAAGGSTFNAPALVVNASGSVGIGETSPSAPLHVEHSSSTAYDSAQEPTESMIVSNKNGTDNSGVDNVASIGLHVADGATSQGFVNYARTGNNTGRFSFTQRTGSSTYTESLSLTPTGLHTTGGLHEVYSVNPSNFVGNCASDTWHNISNYNYQNTHNGPGVDNTAQTITQVIWQNNTPAYGYIVRMYVIHGAYSANTHTIYSSAGTDASLDSGHSHSRIYTGLYDTGGNGGLVYATGHTDIDGLKIGIRFNNHTNVNYAALTMQIKTNAPPSNGTTPIIRIWRI